MNKLTGTVYLLHIDGGYKHARHYLGFTEDETADARVQQHKDGTGSPLIRAAIASGKTVRLVRTWTGDRNFERKIKNRHNLRGVCPVCLQGYNRDARERMKTYRAQD